VKPQRQGGGVFGSSALPGLGVLGTEVLLGVAEADLDGPPGSATGNDLARLGCLLGGGEVVIGRAWHPVPVQRWQGVEDVPEDWPGSVVCIGVFDGVHRGHRSIVARAVERGRALGLPTVVVTFDPHPSEVLRPGTRPSMLSTLDQRVQLLESVGASAVCVLPFTRELSALTPEEFVRAVLVDRLRTKAVVVGENFRFGHRASGDTQTLSELGARYGFDVEPAPLVSGTGGAWSSTYTRALVAAGDVAAAALSLGRPHRVEGIVVHGDERGRELGYPTANIATTAHAAIPLDGVYAGWLVRSPYGSAQALPAAISVGTNPTFQGEERRVEAYVLDRDDLELYDEAVAVDFVARIRPMLKFDDIDELVARMALDVEETRALLG
jgi:riboflavin kinase/FMN adenylyltransferase